MNRLIPLLEKLKTLADGIAKMDFIADIKFLEKKLQEEKLCVVVVGSFKRGKSSLINSLLGKHMVPVSVTPLTAIITLLLYDPEDTFIEVQFTDGRIEKMGIDRASLYVSEEENPANEKQVDLVRIFDNSEMLRKTILVDTPGLGSSFEHNTKTTLRFIPKIDAAIFVLSADMPVSKLDIEFLDKLKQTTSTIIFVLNKADLLNNIELQKMMTHNKKEIAGVLKTKPDEISILPTYAKWCTEHSEENGIAQLKQKIISLAEKEKTQLLQESSSRQFLLLKNQLTSFLQLKLDSLQMPLRELEQKQQQFKCSATLLQEQKDEFKSIINEKIRQFHQQIHETLNNMARDLNIEIKKKVDQNFKQTGSLVDRDTIQHLQQELNELVLSRFETSKEKMEAKAKDYFKTLLQEYSSRSQSFLNEMAKNLSALLGIDFELIAGSFDLEIYTSFYLSLEGGDQPINFDNHLFDKLLPYKTRVKRTVARIKKHFHNIITRNTASMIYDLQYRTQESFRRFNYELDNKMKEVLSRIEKILDETLEQKNKKNDEISGEIKQLQDKIALIRQLNISTTE